MITEETKDTTATTTGSLPRMRTLSKAYEEIKAADPDTAITMRIIRDLVYTGKVQVYCVGRKKLVNLDLLYESLSCYYRSQNNDYALQSK